MSNYNTKKELNDATGVDTTKLDDKRELTGMIKEN